MVASEQNSLLVRTDYKRIYPKYLLFAKYKYSCVNVCVHACGCVYVYDECILLQPKGQYYIIYTNIIHI